ncbi:hypothetical protein Fmac_015596 [Flemingia macrophylla]|uniref:Uncharacterized protein n=1 Tax=Flemingia macrophylla TaxID=520843 RepID=A0ABD1MFW8_9FABA
MFVEAMKQKNKEKSLVWSDLLCMHTCFSEYETLADLVCDTTCPTNNDHLSGDSTNGFKPSRSSTLNLPSTPVSHTSPSRPPRRFSSTAALASPIRRRVLCYVNYKDRLLNKDSTISFNPASGS